MASAIACMMVIVLCVPTTAHAYIDPTAGGLLIQMLLAGAAGIGVVTKLYWRRLVAWLKKPSEEELKK